jgi:RNA polymerase sigma-70 factor (ECF subfamily)
LVCFCIIIYRDDIQEHRLLDETQVLALVRNGNNDAFTEIMELYHMPIQRYLYRLTGDYDTAKDLTQDTFLQAYKNILKTKTDISLKAWLYRIATNNAYQNSRRKKIISFITFKLNIESNNHDIESQSYLTDKNMAVQEALRKIPEKHRACMVLHFIEGFKYKEIAETIGISEEAVRKRVARGSDEFRKIYGSGGGL